MNYSWHVKTVSFDNLDAELTAFTNQGFEIFEILAIQNAHAAIVARKEVSLKMGGLA